MSDLIPAEIKEFIKTKEGKKAFREACPGIERGMRQDRKKSFLDPPKNVVRWLSTMDHLKKEYRNQKKSKELN